MPQCAIRTLQPAISERMREMEQLERRQRQGNVDIIFPDRVTYEHAKQNEILTRHAIAKSYHIPEMQISDFVEFDPGNAIKFTLYRKVPSGSTADPDIGAQQCGLCWMLWCLTRRAEGSRSHVASLYHRMVGARYRRRSRGVYRAR